MKREGTWDSLSAEQRRLIGLRLLMQASESATAVVRRSDPFEYSLPPMRFSEHPFGLTIPKADTNILVLGSLGHTDASVEGLLAYVSMEMQNQNPGEGVQYLRRLLASVDGRSDNHDVYFEVGFSGATFLCGGCTDCSGGGRLGKDRLDAVFEALAHLSGVQIKTILLSDEQTRRGVQMIRRQDERRSVELQEDQAVWRGAVEYFAAFGHREERPVPNISHVDVERSIQDRSKGEYALSLYRLAGAMEGQLRKLQKFPAEVRFTATINEKGYVAEGAVRAFDVSTARTIQRELERFGRCADFLRRNYQELASVTFHYEQYLRGRDELVFEKVTL